MNPEQRRILAAFDRPGTKAINPDELTGDRATPGAIAEMLELGWLRPAAGQNVYERTEDGRLQLAGPRDVTIYSRPGCHLCEQAKVDMAPLLAKHGAQVTEINIDEDAALRVKYDYDVPVIFMGARKIAKHRLNVEQFRRRLLEAEEAGKR